ncbi:YciI family protein [Agromyces italicus]|uniref:YciI family protein n=1 Tax=Agromyces italicus TaxID=279572 RepID=UPI00146CE18B|nr:YciI family protein [Agromyces italicus]
MNGNFVLFVHADPDGWADLDDEAMDAALRDRAAAIEKLRSEGVLIACSPFDDPAHARRVEVRGGHASSSAVAVDAEPIAGFYLIRAADLTEAERFAALIPDAASAHMTVRALMPLPGIPGVIPAPTSEGASHA